MRAILHQDANIFVLARATGALAEACQGLLMRVRQRRIQSFTATVDILPLSVKDLHATKAYRRDYGLLTNDSLILAVMRNSKLRHLASHDSGFKGIAGLQLWMPGAE